MSNRGNFINDEAAYQAAIERRIRLNAWKGRNNRWFAGDATRAELVGKMFAEVNKAYCNPFIVKMVENYQDWGSLTDGQEAAVRKSIANTEAKTAERIEKNKTLEFLGVEGQVCEFNMILKGIRENDGQFGPSKTYKFMDANDNVVYWNTTKNEDMPVGCGFKFFAKVKKHHTSANGGKSTLVKNLKNWELL